MTLRQVIISAHIPPGYFERWPLNPLFFTEKNDRYIQLILNFGHVIAFQVYGHTHTDAFRIFAENSSIHRRLPISSDFPLTAWYYFFFFFWYPSLVAEIRSVAFLAPSVTPWLPGGGVNPGLRLYKYSSTGVKDYWQYFLNLSAPMQPMGNDSTPEWDLLYQATTTYQMPDLHADSLVFFEKMFI